MADVLIVCVREDELQAKALADMFERAGFTVGGAPANDGALRSVGAAVIVWSQAAIRSRPFLDAAQRAIDAEKAVVASLIDPPPPHTVGNAPSFALNGWTGDPEDPSLDPLFFAVDRMVSSQRAAVGAAPAHPAQERFQEPPSLRPPPAYMPPPPPMRARPNPAPPPRPEPRPEMRPEMRAPPPPPARDAGSAESEHWRVIRDSRNPNDFMDFIAKWGAEGSFTELAELRLKQLTGPGAPPTNLRDAARQAQPRRQEPPPPPPRRPDPPPPIRLDSRRPVPPPEPPPRIEPRRDPNYSRDYGRPPEYIRPPEPAPKSGGGLMRALILALLLGGGALAAGLYYGGGADTILAGNDQTSEPDASDELPPPGPAELGVGGEEHAEEPVTLASNEPPAAAPISRREQQRETQRPPRQQQNQQTSAPAQTEEALPAPQTSWSNSASNPASPYTTYNNGGPANLNAPPSGATTQAPPVQVAANNPPAARPPAAPARQGTVQWAQRPSARRIAELYPDRAMRSGAGGRAELACTVRADLTLACTVASETPAEMGFGRAALAASTSYRVQPTLSDGAAAAGARTRIAITFVAQSND